MFIFMVNSNYTLISGFKASLQTALTASGVGGTKIRSHLPYVSLKLSSTA